MRNVRGFFQNFFTCSSGRTRFSKASYTPGYRKKLVSCVSNRSSSASYSRLDLRIKRSRSVPRSLAFGHRFPVFGVFLFLPPRRRRESLLNEERLPGRAARNLHAHAPPSRTRGIAPALRSTDPRA